VLLLLRYDHHDCQCRPAPEPQTESPAPRRPGRNRRAQRRAHRARGHDCRFKLAPTVTRIEYEVEECNAMSRDPGLGRGPGFAARPPGPWPGSSKVNSDPAIAAALAGCSGLFVPLPEP
jgi:hypothetical protein